MGELASVIESIDLPPIEGSLLLYLRGKARGLAKQMAENHRTKSPNGILSRAPRSQNEITEKMLAEAMGRELFLGEPPQVELYCELRSTSSIRLLQYNGLDGLGRLKFFLEDVELEAKEEFAALIIVCLGESANGIISTILHP